jgi:hypothetical protein
MVPTEKIFLFLKVPSRPLSFISFALRTCAVCIIPLKYTVTEAFQAVCRSLSSASAAGPAEAGFWPVINLPSTWTYGAQLSVLL